MERLDFVLLLDERFVLFDRFFEFDDDDDDDDYDDDEICSRS